MSKKLNKILYIEDEPDIISIAEIALQEFGGFELLCCESGMEALKVAPKFNPELFIIDVMMPELDGPATLKRLRKMEQFSQTPAIFMTAKVQLNEIDDLRKMGVLSVIQKPFEPLSLADEIKEIWYKHYGK